MIFLEHGHFQMAIALAQPLANSVTFRPSVLSVNPQYKSQSDPLNADLFMLFLYSVPSLNEFP